MIVRNMVTVAALAAVVAVSFPAIAQTTAGAGTVIVLPLASNIPGAYATTVFVRNPAANPQIIVKVRYYQSDSGNPVGTGTPYACTDLTIPSNAVATFDLASQCTFPGPGVNNFGQIVLEDVTDAPNAKTHRFYAYSRTEATTGNGFSVEGFPVGNFSAAPADAVGLKKTTTGTIYKSNCFVGALGEAVSYQLLLFSGAGGTISTNTISGTLQPYHSVRILDVFAAAGAIAQENVRATFTNSTNSAMIGFCTLETTANGSADFRVAKSESAADSRQSRLACYGMDSCGGLAPSISNPAQITATGTKNIHYAIFDQPDFVKCDLITNDVNDLNDLQMTLRGPGNPLTSPQFALPAGYNTSPYTSGGTAQTGFYIYTGEKSTIASGNTTRWYIDVSFRSGGNAGDLPIDYGIKCTSGNGISVPWLGTTAPTP